MIYKIILLLIFTFVSNISYSAIIYDKNGIIITDIEIRNYIDVYENRNDIKINKNKAIKNIVLMKKTINFLLKYNSEFMQILDQNIKQEFGSKIFNDKSLLNYLRFQKIRNEFISEYFQNNFNIQDLETIFLNYNTFQIPLSKNNCLTIDKLNTFNNDENLIKNIFDILKKREKKFEIIIDNQTYHACINDKLYNDIEKQIIKLIENKTEKSFKEFMYSKIN
jgi:hypothetical protein